MFTESQKNLINEFASIVKSLERAKDKFCDINNDSETTRFWAESLIFWADELSKIQEEIGIEYWRQDRLDSWKGIASRELELIAA